MYYTYILESLNHSKTYVGITNDLFRRLTQHNSGYNTFSKRYSPWRIIHKETFKNRIEARKKEKYLKSAAGRKWIRYNLF